MKTRDQTLAVLARHIGEANGIPCAALATEIGETERNVRKLIAALRESGIAVCGLPSTGYFIARTDAELDRCCAFLRARSMHSLRQEAQMRRIALPDLIGQLHLPT